MRREFGMSVALALSCSGLALSTPDASGGNRNAADYSGIDVKGREAVMRVIDDGINMFQFRYENTDRIRRAALQVPTE